MQEKKVCLKKKYLFIWTVVFCFVCFWCFSMYIIEGKTLIYNEDGWNEYYKAYLYYAKWLRTIAKGIIIERKLSIPEWDFCLGEGADIYETLCHDVMGDPFAFPLVLIPDRFVWLYINIVQVLKIYTAGVAFSWMCIYKKRCNYDELLAGTLAYTFCNWMIVNVAKHVMFLNPMIYLPILIIGIDKVIKKKNPLTLISFVAISIITNLYIAYIIAVCAAIYTVVSVILYKGAITLKEKMLALLRVVIYSIFGACLSAVSLMPSAYYYLQAGRASVEYSSQFLYPLTYYSSLPGRFVSVGDTYALCMGFAVPVLIAVFYIFTKKNKYTKEKIILAVCLIAEALPIVGKVTNGFLYPTNRWSFAMALLVSYILVVTWDKIIYLSAGEVYRLFVLLVMFTILCTILKGSRTVCVFFELCLGFIFLFIILYRAGDKEISQKLYRLLLVMIVVVCVISNSYWKHGKEVGNAVAKGVEPTKFDKVLDYDTNAVKKVGKDINGKYRYSGRGLEYNAGMLAGVQSFTSYFSALNPYTSEFRSLLGIFDSASNYYKGYDGMSYIDEMLGCNYFVTSSSDKGPIPFGYSYADNVKCHDSGRTYTVYKKENALPIAFIYESYISRDDWNNLQTIDKQEELLKSCVFEEDIDNYLLMKSDYSYDSENLDFDITCESSYISIQDEGIVVTKPNQKITLNVNGKGKDYETYLEIRNLHYEGCASYELYKSEKYDPNDLYKWNELSRSKKNEVIEDKIWWTVPLKLNIDINSSNGTKKSFIYYNNNHLSYSGQHSFMFN